MRPFRFAVHTGRLEPPDDWAAFARRVEELGYDALYVTDHLGAQLAPIAAMAAAAAATRRLRIGAYVFANDFRHPLVLAREAATLDRLSGGRLELGLGAGWMRSDYRQLGRPYDPPARRIDRLEEALSVVIRLLRGEVVTHRGPHYRLEDARVGPLPVQLPHPPIMLGGGGPRLLRLAARHAQIVGLAPQMSASGRPMLRLATDAAFEERAALVRRAAGDRWESLELNAFVADAGIVGGSQPIGSSLAALVKSAGPALAGGSPYVLYGSVAQLRESLLKRRARTGLSSYGLPADAMEAFAPLIAELAGH
ncbi:MAG TPA: TIGR03621 family F420-dependent LLM class oxidoreductase [Candidatus Angelobacter sp.]|nr:TIGR03621 family F420-dependent LLM class oxidoreductase [Candidatus Angelobacter sp.]